MTPVVRRNATNGYRRLNQSMHAHQLVVSTRMHLGDLHRVCCLSVKSVHQIDIMLIFGHNMQSWVLLFLLFELRLWPLLLIIEKIVCLRAQKQLHLITLMVQGRIFILIMGATYIRSKQLVAPLGLLYRMLAVGYLWRVISITAGSLLWTTAIFVSILVSFSIWAQLLHERGLLSWDSSELRAAWRAMIDRLDSFPLGYRVLLFHHLYAFQIYCGYFSQSSLI